MDEYSKMHQVDLEFKCTELYKVYEVVSEAFSECGRWRTRTHECFSSSWQNFNFSFSHTPLLAALRCTLCFPGPWYMAFQLLKRDSQTELQLQKYPHFDRKQTNPGPDKARKTRIWIHWKMPDEILMLKWHWKTHNTHIKCFQTHKMHIKCT